MSDTTLRAGRDERIDASVFEQLKTEVLAAFDRVIGLDLDDAALDASLHKAPYGGKGTGPNPTDRAKLGWKWSVASKRHCPHPVVRLVDRRLDLYLWREDNWAGSYRVVNQIEAATPTGPSLCFDGGRFVLSAVDDPEARRAMHALRLAGEAFLTARDQPTS